MVSLPCFFRHFIQQVSTQRMSFRKARVIKRWRFGGTEPYLVHHRQRATIRRHRKGMNQRQSDLGKTETERGLCGFRRDSLSPQGRMQSPANFHRRGKVCGKRRPPQSDKASAGKRAGHFDRPRSQVVMGCVRHDSMEHRVTFGPCQRRRQKLRHTRIGIQLRKQRGVIRSKGSQNESSGADAGQCSGHSQTSSTTALSRLVRTFSLVRKKNCA